MNPPDRVEIAAALFGAWRLIRGDAAGTGYFRAGREGFWAAAWAIVLVLPAHLLAHAILVAATPTASFGLYDAIREALIFSIGWFGYALLAFHALERFGKPERFDAFLTAFYWTTVPLAYANVALSLLGVLALLPQALFGLLALGYLALVIWTRWFVARTTLAIKDGEAGIVVGATLLFDLLVSKILSRLF